MTREGAVAVMIGVAVLILALAAFAWWRRTRRDSGLSAPVAEAPAGAETMSEFRSLYVATTKHGEPLERLAIRGLAFRSRVDVTVTSAGIALDLTGKPRVFVRADRIDLVAQATVTIDRVVERDGLVRLTWRLDDGTVVDSYLRPQDASARALTDAISSILTPTQTGTDA
ncbi:PH-like domain-containing protein [Microbacterium sp. NPDC055357]